MQTEEQKRGRSGNKATKGGHWTNTEVQISASNFEGEFYYFFISQAKYSDCLESLDLTKEGNSIN